MEFGVGWRWMEGEDPSSAAATLAEKEEADARSIYVGNVDYACTPEEVQQHFQSCGTVNRVTILTDKFGQPKGFAYVEFVELESVQNSLLLNESELHGRQLKVAAKRTNIPGMKQFRGRRPNPYLGFRSRRPFMPGPPMFPPYGYGYVPEPTLLAVYFSILVLFPRNFGGILQLAFAAAGTRISFECTLLWWVSRVIVTLYKAEAPKFLNSYKMSFSIFIHHDMFISSIVMETLRPEYPRKDSKGQEANVVPAILIDDILVSMVDE
ncbi:Nucleotide-binding, alpha-beta plait [Cynara cardunculus var. scolymus]|uniref:Nucleotide-binding, alpha-beta plait n=1 Tax=Cynara cardunculus var. scolymus TaxID=59895 RepID=A0A118K469_CYNCS|nr:Nucleotide-binding, alpha-beta plait [Cynara cardunculus var. scolymus]